MRTLDILPDLEICYLGPDVSEGPMPAVFYFALSAPESLNQDPIAQPVQFLKQFPIRIFSVTLPGHGVGLDPAEAIEFWAARLAEGNDVITDVIEKIVKAIEILIDKNIIWNESTVLSGLSRGAFIASHVAARTQIPFLLGFAPLTRLTYSQAFHHLQNNPIAAALNLEPYAEKLMMKQLRFYMGNHDTLVGTHNCFHFIESIAQAAYTNSIRSSPIEMIIGPSIGFKGHGTSKEVFENGAAWAAKMLGF